MGSSIELYHRTVGFDAILGGGTKPSLTVLMLEENITYISPLQQPRMYWLIWVSSKRKNSCPRMSAYKLKKGGSSGRGRGWGSAVALRMAYYRSRAQLAWCASFSPSLPPIAFLCCLLCGLCAVHCIFRIWIYFFLSSMIGLRIWNEGNGRCSLSGSGGDSSSSFIIEWLIALSTLFPTRSRELPCHSLFASLRRLCPSSSR